MVLLGASGHATEVLQVLLHNGFAEDEIVFFDNTRTGNPKLYERFPIITSDSQLEERLKSNPDFLVAVGNPFLRKRFFELALLCGGNPSNVFSKTATVGKYVKKIGVGLNVMQGVLISDTASIENGVLLNAFCHVHHGASIGEFSEISPKAMILGDAAVGQLTQIGAGAIVLPKIRVGENSIIGAGSVVVADIPNNCVAVGVPAVVVKYID